MSAIVTSRHVAGGLVPGVAPDGEDGVGGAEGVASGGATFEPAVADGRVVRGDVVAAGVDQVQD